MKKSSIVLGALGMALLLPFAVMAMENANDGDFGLCFPDAVTQDSFVGKTLVNGRLRAVACMNGSKTLAVLPANTKVKIVAKTDGWYKVTTQDGKTGWMGAWIIAKTSDTSFTQTTSDNKTKKEEVKAISFGTTVSNVEKLELKDLYSLIDKIRARIAELEKKNTTVSDSTTSNGKLTLTGTVSGGKVSLKWSMTDMTSPNGFKVVYANHENPVYPGDEYHYLSDSSAYTDEWSMDPGTYYFRVCEYTGNGCDVYSNNLKVTVSEGSTATTGKITLTGSVVNGKVKLNWSVSDMTSPNGFKIAIANHENPVYPGDDYHYLSDKSARTDEWTDLSPGTYYFRVCEYLGGKCGLYSNNLKVTVSEGSTATTGKITLTASVVNGVVKLNWSLSDMTSPMGFKVAAADHENPVYPGDDYHYLSDQSVRSDEWTDLSSGTHYFRVCEYLGGKCGLYSNNVRVVIP